MYKMNGWASLATLFLLLGNALGNEWTLTILHTNDVHSRIEQSDEFGAPCSEGDKCFGGMARIHTKVQDIRSTHDNVLFLDGGDQFQGTLWFYHYKGDAVKHFTQKLNYSVMALGNHEFDNGVDGLSPFLENISFPVLSANIDSSEVPLIDGLFKPSHVFDVSGHQVGLVGYTTTETPKIVNPEGVKGLVFEDEIGKIQEEVNILREKGVKTVIAVGHAGFTKDQEIAKKVDGVDLVVGGHTNTFLYNGDPPSTEEPVGPYPVVITQDSGKEVPVVQAYTNGKYLGYLNLTIDDEGHVAAWNGNPILLDDTIPEDPDILKDVEEWAEPLQNMTNTVVGSSLVLLEGIKEVCRSYECNMGNMITDSMVNFYLSRHTGENGTWAQTSVAIWNSGGIRTSIVPGEFTIASILAVMPFRNSIERIAIYGSTLKKILEHSVANYGSDDPGGEFLQYSGLKVSYDVEKERMNRVQDIQILCSACQVPKYEPWHPDTVYQVLVADYLLAGGDGYSFVVDELLDRFPYGDMISEVVMEYTGKFSPIIHSVEGRITFTTEEACSNGNASFRNSPSSLLSYIIVCVFVYLKRNHV